MIHRRCCLAGIAAVAGVPASAVKAALQPAPYPLVPPLPPLAFDHMAELLLSFEKHSRTAFRPDLPEEVSVLYQHMAGLRWCIMSWPHADAVERLHALTKQWPRLKANIDLVIAARLEGRSGWPWDYSRIRIDGGPPRRPELPALTAA